jgi:hypothetical protein
VSIFPHVWRLLGPLQMLVFGWDLFRTTSVTWAWLDLFFVLNATVLSIDAYVAHRGAGA